MFKFLSDKTKEAAANQIEHLVISCTRAYHSSLKSPIEELLFEAIVTHEFCTSGTFPRVVIDGKMSNDEGDWIITPQAPIKNFRVDFLVEASTFGVKAVIECDGHEFHERTKEQARKDRSRDRELQSLGYLVLRYTGSEIWRDPWVCAQDIARKIYDFHQSSGGA